VEEKKEEKLEVVASDRYDSCDINSSQFILIFTVTEDFSIVNFSLVSDSFKL
jgi:hypothetical protein